MDNNYPKAEYPVDWLLAQTTHFRRDGVQVDATFLPAALVDELRSEANNLVMMTLGPGQTASEALSSIKRLLGRIGLVVEEFSSLAETSWMGTELRSIVGLLLKTASVKGIEFSALVQCLLNKKPMASARFVVDIEDVQQSYGRNSAIEWNELLSRSLP